MAASTISNVSDSLKRVYESGVTDYHLNVNAEFFTTQVQRLKKLKPLGSAFYWPFWLQSPQNMTTPAEDGSIGGVSQRTAVQGSINSGQVVNKFQLSWLLEAAGTGEGAFDKDEVKRESWEAVTDATKHVNRLLAGTHGTGRLGQIESTISSATTFVGKLPFGVLLLRPKMVIDVFTLESGGSQELDSIQITKIAFNTRTCTIASSSATANSHIYLEDTRGNATLPNGIDGIVDDGTNLTSIHGQSRSSYEELKSVVLGNSGALRDLSEDLLVRGAFLVRQRSGQSIDCLLMNTGQMESYLRFVRPDRRRSFDGKGAVGHDTGYEDMIYFVYGGKKCPLYVSEDVKPRTVYGLTKSQLRFFELAKMGFKDWGGTIFQQGITSSVYNTTYVATLWYPFNFGTYMPSAHFKIEDLSDPQLCGAEVGGSDAYLS